jgi:putative phage-type endonuclease
MSARLVTGSDATRAEWLAARRQGITASEIAAVMGLSSWESPYSLFFRKTGDLPAQEDNEAKRLGRYLEDYVCQRFAEQYPQFHVEGNGRELYGHPDRPWELATPDRLVYEDYAWRLTGGGKESLRAPIAVLEAKTSASYDGWGDDGSDVIPVAYRCQVLWQLDVLQVSTAYVPTLFLHSRQVRVYELTMDADAEHDLKLMRDTAQCFLDDIRDRKAPEVDWRPQTSAALKRLYPGLEDREVIISRTLIGQYRGACSALRKAEQRKKLAENRIRARLGNGRRVVAPDGEAVATRQVYDVKEHLRKASKVDKLVPAKATS